MFQDYMPNVRRNEELVGSRHGDKAFLMLAAADQESG